MTIPNMISSVTEHQCVSGLLKFNSTLQQAVELWKQDIGCTDSAYNCLASQNLADAQISNFDQIAKFMRVSDSVRSIAGSDKAWLSDRTLNYYGVNTIGTFGRVTKPNHGDGAFLLEDGTTFSMDVEPASFEITVDVNGPKPPNRVGKDTFRLLIGRAGQNQKDIFYCAYHPSVDYDNTSGLCLCGSACDINNVDPNVGNGTSPMAYVILNHKWPDFKGLAAKYPGTFMP